MKERETTARWLRRIGSVAALAILALLLGELSVHESRSEAPPPSDTASTRSDKQYGPNPAYRLSPQVNRIIRLAQREKKEDDKGRATGGGTQLKTAPVQKKETAPVKKSTTPTTRKKETAPVKKETAPVKKEMAPVKKSTTPTTRKKETAPVKKETAPVKKDTAPAIKKETAPAPKKEIAPVTKEVAPTETTAPGTGPTEQQIQENVEFCAKNPNDPSCSKGGAPPSAATGPSPQEQENIEFCAQNPSDPSCSKDAPPPPSGEQPAAEDQPPPATEKICAANPKYPGCDKLTQQPSLGPAPGEEAGQVGSICEQNPQLPQCQEGAKETTQPEMPGGRPEEEAVEGPPVAPDADVGSGPPGFIPPGAPPLVPPGPPPSPPPAPTGDEAPPPGPTIQTVTECPEGQVAWGDQCISPGNCPPGEVSYTDYSVDPPQAACGASCPEGMFERLGGCIGGTVCFNQGGVHYDGECLLECPPGTEGQTWCQQICTAQQVRHEGQCLDACPANTIEDDGECVPGCPENQILTTTGCIPTQCGEGEYRTASGQCVTECPEGTTPNSGIDMGAVPHCQPQCAEGELVQVAECVQQCSEPMGYDYVVDGRCLRFCPQGLAGHEGECLDECPSGMTDVNGVCRADCTETQVDWFGQCLDPGTCPEGEVQVGTGDAGAQCAASCPEGQINRLGVCIPAGECTGIEYEGQCVGQCPEGTLRNRVAANTYQCVSACPEGTVVQGGTCIAEAECGNVVHEGQCMQNCPTGLVASEGQCADACPSGQLVLVGSFGDSCVASCPDGYGLQDAQCLAVNEAGCLGDGVRDDDNQCVAYLDCYQGGGVPHEGECRDDCPGNQVQLGSQCTEECPEGWFEENDQCLTYCSTGSQDEAWFCRDCPEGTVYAGGRQCRPECAADEMYHEGLNQCGPACDLASELLVDGACVAWTEVGYEDVLETCQEQYGGRGTNYPGLDYSGQSSERQCELLAEIICSSEEFGNLPFCADRPPICGEGEIIATDGSCTASCGEGQYVLNDFQCTSSCLANQVVFGNECREGGCPQGYDTQYGSGLEADQCIANCPPGQTRGADGQCSNPCPEGQQFMGSGSYGSACRDICPEGQVFAAPGASSYGGLGPCRNQCLLERQTPVNGVCVYAETISYDDAVAACESGNPNFALSEGQQCAEHIVEMCDNANQTGSSEARYCAEMPAPSETVVAEGPTDGEIPPPDETAPPADDAAPPTDDEAPPPEDEAPPPEDQAPPPPDETAPPPDDEAPPHSGCPAGTFVPLHPQNGECLAHCPSGTVGNDSGYCVAEVPDDQAPPPPVTDGAPPVTGEPGARPAKPKKPTLSELTKDSPIPLKLPPVKPLAVVIGIGDYKDAGIQAAPQAIDNAAHIVRFLKTDLGMDGDRIVTGRNATSSDFEDIFGKPGDTKSELRDILNKMKTPEVIVYYAGRAKAIDGGKDVLLLPADAEPDKPATGISLSALYNQLAAMGIPKLRVYLDPSFVPGDAVTVVETAPRVGPFGVLTPQGWVALSAARDDAAGPDEAGRPRSHFTESLVAGLRGIADTTGEGDGDGTVSAKELYEFTRDQAAAAAKRGETVPVPTLYGRPDEVLRAY